jgi:hypothetical protein
MRLTTAEEVEIILTDIFDGDVEGEKACLQNLASQQEMDLTTASTEEVQELILENEDILYTLYDQYTKNHDA